MVKRLENWPKLLSHFLAERAKMPFEWGVNDCMAFAAKGVEALTGHDFFSLYSDYTDEASAIEMLRRNGGVSGIITACLGIGTDKVMTARRGDVALVRVDGHTGGLVDDSGQRVALVTKDGLIRVPLSAAVRVWGY
jgi:hypothetical protein